MPFTVTTPTSGSWTYTRLQAAIANWLNRSDLTAYIPDFITFAESRFNRELRIRAMETSLSSIIPKSTNYLVYSEQFDHASWIKVLNPTVSPNVILSPIGDLTADVITFPNVTNGERIEQSPAPAIAGDVYTFSVYLTGTGTIDILVGDDTGEYETELVVTLTDQWTRSSVTVTITDTITDLNPGYIRAAIVWRTTNTATTVYAWGAQLEKTDTLGTYRKTESTSFTSTNTIPIPSDYLELKHAFLTSDPQTMLERTSPSALYQRYSNRTATGVPTAIARDGDYFVFGPFPDQEYTLQGIYYAKFESLSDTTTYNWLLVNAPEVYLFGSLIEAEPFIKNDPRIAMWEAKYQAAISRVQNESDRESFSGTSLRMTVL